jgi:hypothetical protein
LQWHCTMSDEQWIAPFNHLNHRLFGVHFFGLASESSGY